MSEVSNWYNDFALFVNANGPWVYHGGRFCHGFGTGIFDFSGSRGFADEEVATRSVLLLDSNLS